ncbi:MAG: N-acetylmuramoyl-L-alanine amidase [Bacteroidota bacterium]
MLTIAYYFLQVVLCSGMMIGYYWLVLRNKRFHQYNRFYLLALVLLSWIVPLIKISWSKPVAISDAPQVMQFLSVVADNNSQIEQTISKQGFVWSWNILATGIYFVVAAILLLGMLRAFARLYRLLKDHSCKNVGDIYLVLTQAKGTPFSFFRYIFWNEEIDIRSEAGKQILQHELTHVQQKHSFDKLFMQVMLIGGWFNPFFWLVRKEMDMIHEFIADKKAVNNGDTAALAQMLLTAAYPQQQFALTHPFFFSPIKRRLQMLTNNIHPRFSYLRRLIVLPLLAIVVILFSFRNKEENGTLSVASVMENVVDAISTKLLKTERAAIPLISNVTLGRTYTVVIDAGHGGNDKGAVGADGTPESGITLTMAKAIRDLNTNDHIRIILTRDEDIYQHPTEKAAIANGYRPDLFVSLHCNETLNIKKRNNFPTTGIEIFIPAKENSADYDGSVVLAYALSNSLNGLHEKMLGVKTRNKLIHVLKDVQSPAVLIQTGFMTNPNDLKKLKDADYQNQMAASILQGINNYLQSSMRNTIVKEVFPPNVTAGSFDAFAGNMKTNAGYRDMTLPVDNLLRSTLKGVQITDTIPSTMPAIENHKRVNDWRTDTTLSRWKMGNVLFILDGVTYDFLNMPSFDPDQIESITVLKSPASVSQYGEAGKDGVLLITTKTFAKAQRAISANNHADSIKIANWRPAPGIQVQGKKFPDTLIWVQGQQIPAMDNRGMMKARTVPLTVAGKRIEGRPVFEGMTVNNSPAVIEFKKRNPEIKSVLWWRDKTHIIIQLKDGTEETYDLENPESKKRAETKYGKLPEVPAVVANAPVRDEVTVVGYGTRRSGKELSETLPADKPAEFPGGPRQLNAYFGRYINRAYFPKNSVPMTKYRFTISAIIGKDGSLSNINVENEQGLKVKDDIVSALVNGPKWIPAVRNGQNTSFAFKTSIILLDMDGDGQVHAAVFDGQKRSYYYYCWSKPRPVQGSTAKETVLYTDVKNIVCDEADLMLKVREWGNIVNEFFPGPYKRSSDLNQCQGYADGEKQIAGILSRYNDPQKYELKKIPLAAELVARLDPYKNISEPR